jgi:two-component system response regulator RegA
MSESAAREGAPTMLVVDDDDALRERLARAFRERGFEVTTASRGAEALARAREETPEYAVLDLRMPDQSGLEVLRRMRALDPSTRILVLTGYGSIATAVEATRLGAVGYLPKPADADEILAAFAGHAGEAAAAPIETPSLARTEWEHIQRVLADCGGNVSEAARRLGIHRRSLQRKLQKYPPSR